MRFLKEEYQLDNSTKTEKSQEQEQETRIEYESTIIPHRGHKVFEINNETLEISEAEFEESDLVFDPNFSKGKPLNIERKIIRKDGCSYVSALNPKNALKQFKKGRNGSLISANKQYLEL